MVVLDKRDALDLMVQLVHKDLKDSLVNKAVGDQLETLDAKGPKAHAVTLVKPAKTENLVRGEV